MKLVELREQAKNKGCLGVNSMNKKELELYIETGVKYKKNQVTISTQTEIHECKDCSLQTELTRMRKKAKEAKEKKKKRELKKNTIVTEHGEMIDTRNGELIGFTTAKY